MAKIPEMKIKIDANKVEERLVKIFENIRSEIKERIAFGLFGAFLHSYKPVDIVRLWKIANKNEKQRCYDLAEIILKIDIKELNENKKNE